MKKTIFGTLIAVFLIFLSACEKRQNQKVVRKLAGTWVVTSYKVVNLDGSVDELSGNGTSFKIQFDDCKLKQDESCLSTWTSTDSTQTNKDYYNYVIHNKGRQIEFNDYPYSEQYRISEFTKNSMTWIGIGPEDGITVQLQRQE